MEKELKAVFLEIRSLLDVLESRVSGDSSNITPKLKSNSSRTAVPKGAMGAITILINEGFFNTPKTIILIMEKLKERGYYYKHNAISMNLLNLTKKRQLNRFKDKKEKKWMYVLRKLYGNK